MNSFESRFASWVIAHKWLVVTLTLLMVVLLAMGAKRLVMSGDYRVFFKPDNPQLQAFESLQKTYTKSDNILFVLEPANGDMITQANLAAIIELTNKAWQMPHSIRVDSISNYQHSVADGDTLNVADLVQKPAQYTADDLKRIRDVATHDPLLVKRLISASGHVTGVNVTLQMPGKNKAVEMREAVTFARQLKTGFEASHPNIKVHMTGVVMLNSAFLEATRSDMRTLVPLMLGVVVILLLLTLRNATGTGLIVLSILLSIAAAMGAGGWMNAVVSVPVATAPLTILIMAIADGVHTISHYSHNLRHGMDREGAMTETITTNFRPMLLTNVLSAVGYLSMNFSEVPPFHTLGNIVAVGIMTAFVLSLTLIPALMLILPGKIQVREEGKITLMERYQDYFLANRNKLLFGSIAITLLMGSFVTQNRFDDSFHEYFDQKTAFRQDTDFTLKNLTGVYLVDFSLKSGEPGAISEPLFLKKTEDFSAWLRTQPEVLHVNTLTDIMKRLNQNMHADDPAWNILPESRDLAAQYLLLYEMSLPMGLDLTNQIDIDKTATRITVTLKAVTSTEMIAFEQRANHWLNQNKASVLTSTGGSGAGMMFAHVGQENGISMMTGNVWQIIIISLLIIFAVRSFKLGLVSLIPNLTPAILAYGVWGLTVGQINMGVSMVAGISLGIVVDDTVHFLTQYLHARRELNQTPEQAIRHAFNLAGVPMWISTFILVAGFMVLASSHFTINADMGLLTAVTIGFAALTEAFMLPGLLLLIDRDPNRKP